MLHFFHFHRVDRIAQEELRQQLENLSEQLKAIEQIQTTPPELDIYVRKLINIKHKVTVVFSVLQGAQVGLAYNIEFSL